MKDSDPPDSDDDGWGDAANKAPPASEAAIDNEWDDPVNLEKRVAALKEQRGPEDDAGLTAKLGEITVPAQAQLGTDGLAPSAASVSDPLDESVAFVSDPLDENDSSASNPVDENAASGSYASDESAASASYTSDESAASASYASGESTASASYESAAPASDASDESGAPASDPGATTSAFAASAAETTLARSMAARDDVVLPPPSADLRAAAGIGEVSASTRKQADTPKKTKSKKKTKPAKTGPKLTPRQKIFIVGGSAALVVAGVCAVLGWFNSQNYYLRCNTESISAQQGRFWPWGENPLAGPAFRPIQVPRDVQCTDEHYNSRSLLEQAFLKVLLAQSTALLTSGNTDNVSRAEAQLNQALLLTRSPDRSAQRAEAVRLEGDVSYWRGAAQMQAAAEYLQESATYFSEAASKRPRHANDANAWAEHAKFIKSEIDKGPHSLRDDDAPKDKPHFQGLTDDTKSSSTQGEPASTPPEELAPDAGLPDSPPDAAIPPADAALPKGGVLL